MAQYRAELATKTPPGVKTATAETRPASVRRPADPPTPEQSAPASPEALLHVEDACYAYGSREVLRGANLDAYPGEILVLLGRNGAGKSTLVKAITGRIALSRGRLSVSGHDPRQTPAARASIGLVPQQLAIYDKLTPRENLTVFGRLMGVAPNQLEPAADALLERIGLSARANDPVRSLSGGMKRRVNIGAALMHQPKLLILDEPTVGIDTRAREDISDMLRQLRDDGLAILLTTHHMEEAEALADRVAIMVDGQIMASGAPDALVREYFGDRMEISVTAAKPIDAAMEADECAALRGAGFTVDPRSNVVRGLIELSGDDLPRVFRTLLADKPEAQEIRVRRPGLDTLLNHFADKGSHFADKGSQS